MTDRTQPEALRALADAAAWTGKWYDDGCNTVHCTYDKEDSIEHDEIAHPVPLGVSGYIAAAHPQAVIALLDRIAELEAQLSSSGFTPADMATASAQGFRDGVASLAASAGSEPVAWLVCSVNSDGTLSLEHAAAWQEAAHEHINDAITEHGIDEAVSWVVRPAYTHPSPPEGMVGGWQDIATAPKDGARILLHPAVEVHDAWSKGDWSEQQECWIVGGSASGVTHTHWLPLPPAPPASEAKGE